MPVYVSKSGYGYTYKKEKIKNKKSKTKKRRNIFTIIISLILLGVISFLGAKLFIYFNNTTEDIRYVYALNILSTSSYDEAVLTSDYIKNQGASGYIFYNENKYDVLLSCYYAEQDAEKVMNNLNQNGYKISLKKIEFPIKKMDEQNFTNALNCFYDSYLKLYNISIEFDKNNLSLQGFKDSVNMLISENEEIINSFNEFYKGSSVSKVIYTKIYLDMLQNNLKQLSSKQSNLSSEIKSHYFYVIFLYQQLLQNI